jgi:hypothetical protein
VVKLGLGLGLGLDSSEYKLEGMGLRDKEP